MGEGCRGHQDVGHQGGDAGGGACQTGRRLAGGEEEVEVVQTWRREGNI